MKQKTIDLITKDDLEKVCGAANISFHELTSVLLITEQDSKLSAELRWERFPRPISDVVKRDVAYSLEKLFKTRSKEVEAKLGIRGKVNGVTIDIDNGTVDWTISYMRK